MCPCPSNSAHEGIWHGKIIRNYCPALYFMCGLLEKLLCQTISGHQFSTPCGHPSCYAIYRGQLLAPLSNIVTLKCCLHRDIPPNHCVPPTEKKCLTNQTSGLNMVHCSVSNCFNAIFLGNIIISPASIVGVTFSTTTSKNCTFDWNILKNQYVCSLTCAGNQCDGTTHTISNQRLAFGFKSAAGLPLKSVSFLVSEITQKQKCFSSNMNFQKMSWESFMCRATFCNFPAFVSFVCQFLSCHVLRGLQATPCAMDTAQQFCKCSHAYYFCRPSIDNHGLPATVGENGPKSSAAPSTPPLRFDSNLCNLHPFNPLEKDGSVSVE